MSDHRFSDFERLSVSDNAGGYILVKPHGLERCASDNEMLGMATLEQIRDACQRYSARKTTMPGSYAHQHYIETGHAFGFGCCLDTDAA